MKSDQRTGHELSILKELRDRTYDDIHFFVSEREKKHWRLWDRYGGHMYKPLLENSRLTLKQLRKRIKTHLLMIAHIEPRYELLITDIPPYNRLNAEIIQFVTNYLGNDGWLQMFQLRQLR